jgi:hypothetical protein
MFVYISSTKNAKDKVECDIYLLLNEDAIIVLFCISRVRYELRIKNNLIHIK